eukprot:282602_1
MTTENKTDQYSSDESLAESLATNSGKIYEGPLYKRGRYTRSWKLRWFILYDTRQLACYNDKNTTQKAIEEIDLRKVENIINDRTKDVKNKYVFELITNSRSFYLACLDKSSLWRWVQELLQMVNGRQIHFGWLIKKGLRTRSWRKRWFRLSDLKKLRYYEDETQKKKKKLKMIYSKHQTCDMAKKNN